MDPNVNCPNCGWTADSSQFIESEDGGYETVACTECGYEFEGEGNA